MSKVISTIARTTVTNFAGQAIVIEVVLGENGFYGVISHGMTDGKVYLTEEAARAAANRTWKHIRSHADGPTCRDLGEQLCGTDRCVCEQTALVLDQLVADYS